MAFEVYKSRGERVEKLTIVTLSKASLVLNKYSRAKLGKPKFIELAYDPDTNTIRIKPKEEGIAIKKTKVFAKGFFNCFDITVNGKFKAEYNEDDTALYVNLNNRL